MLEAVKRKVLVDLVGDHDEIVLDGDVGDALQFAAGEHLAGGVVRRVEQDQLGARGDRCSYFVEVDAECRRMQCDGSYLPAGHRNTCLIDVEHRLERDDLVAGVQQGQQRTGQSFTGSCGDQHLGGSIEAQAVEALLVFDNGLAQAGDANGRWVLVLAAVDCCDRYIEHLTRAIGVGETLAEVDRVGGKCQRGHFTEDGGSKTLELGRQIGQTIRHRFDRRALLRDQCRWSVQVVSAGGRARTNGAATHRA
ncbi:unannotated protein [freshwater metagenome]|uniref:Unannotated protein n=1 Tax=freshwater metagenome TaxID=449393 RepID=A0A6J7EU43_9ZZZZ